MVVCSDTIVKYEHKVCLHHYAYLSLKKKACFFFGSCYCVTDISTDNFLAFSSSHLFCKQCLY